MKEAEPTRKKKTFTYSCNIKLQEEFEEIVALNYLNKSQIIESMIKKWVQIYKGE